MTRSSEDTKQRILAAAVVEFAEHGIAGARTSRIAATAGANEALLFRYFGSKRALFDTVFDGLVARTLDDVPITPADLGAYAGRLFDYYQDNDTLIRMTLWASLDRATPPTPRVLDAFQTKLEGIERAQAAEEISSALPPAEMLALVIQLSLSGSHATASFEPPAVDRKVRRASVVHAVRLLTAG